MLLAVAVLMHVFLGALLLWGIDRRRARRFA